MSVATRLVALLAAAVLHGVLMYTISQHATICFSFVYPKNLILSDSGRELQFLASVELIAEIKVRETYESTV